MKTLYLIRHAEASSQQSGEKDYDRPLSERGTADVARMGGRLSRRLKPDMCISSPAVRAKTTATLLATAIGCFVADIILDERIYEAEPEELLSVIRGVDRAATCLMLVGHNPALTQLVDALVQRDIANMPPCSIAMVRFPTDLWEDVGRVNAELVDFDYPGKS